jgi:hypothetical protein
MVTRHRALARLIRHSKTLICLSCKGTESFWIPRFLSDQAGLSVHRFCGTWPDTLTCKVVRCWGFERWMSHVSLPICFQLSVRVVRCYSHLARPWEVFHNWCGKTCGLLVGQNCDARPESWRRPKSGYTIGVISSNRSHIFQPESGIRPKSCIRPESWYTYIISMYNG